MSASDHKDPHLTVAYRSEKQMSKVMSLPDSQKLEEKLIFLNLL